MVEKQNKPKNMPIVNIRPGLLERIRQKFQYGLVMLSMQKVLSSYGIHFIPYYWVLEGQKALKPLEIRDPGKIYDLRYLTEKDITVMVGVSGITHEKIANLQKQLTQGKMECIGLFQESKLAALMYMEYGVINFNKYRVELLPNEAYFNDMYTFHDFRGKNLAPYLRYQAYQLLRKRGIERFYSISDYWNQSTHRFKHKLGAKKLELRLRIGLFNLFESNIRLKRIKE